MHVLEKRALDSHFDRVGAPLASVLYPSVLSTIEMQTKPVAPAVQRALKESGGFMQPHQEVTKLV